MRNRTFLILCVLCVSLVLPVHGTPFESKIPNKEASFSGDIFTSYHWHMQQPIYWGAEIPDANPPTYQKAWQSIQLQGQQGGHPQNDLNSIFGKADRVNDYQHYMTDAIKSCSNSPTMGAQSSFSGCLIENLNSLAGNSFYPQGWQNNYAGFVQNSKTPSGNPKLDFVSFTYHHALAPLIDSAALEMEIEIHKQIYGKTWGSIPYSKGFFPAEMAFSERIIPSLVKQGIQWVLVPNIHLSRACKNYPYTPHGDNNNPPNPADQIMECPNYFFNMSISRGVTTKNAVPYSFQAHWAKHVDPQTGKESKIIVVPAAMGMSWQDGYECYGDQDIMSFAHLNNASNPMIVVFAHDGDNDFGGGNTYYDQCVSSFVGQAVNDGMTPSTIQDFLDKHPPAEDDVIHIEDGAWPNADGDFGAPRFTNWNFPLTKMTNASQAGPVFDIEHGYQVNERNWAVITAAMNHVQTAEAAAGGVNPAQVQQPSSGVTNAELAWHFFLPSLTSGYMYYGAILDMADKQSVSCNLAVQFADKAIQEAEPEADTTPPSMWYVMRHPLNPGGCGMGDLYGYQYTALPTDFYIYTFAYDVSGIKNTTLFYRIDDDGENPLDDNANEMYDPQSAGLSGVGPWKPVTMTRRTFPSGDEDGIKFEFPPKVIADQFTAHITGLKNVLVDYYVETIDTSGNVKKSDIMHVFVGSGNAQCTGATN